MYSLLVVDQDSSSFAAVRQACAGDDVRTLVADSCERALEFARAAASIDVAVVRHDLPDGKGFEVLEALRSAHPDARLVLLTAEPNVDTVLAAMRLGADDCLVGSVPDLAVLTQRVCELLSRVRKRSEKQRSVRRARANEELYSMALQATGDAVWDWDLLEGDAHFSPRWREMLGYEASEINDDVEAWFARVHPDDVARMQAEIHAALDGEGNLRCDTEFRIRHKDGRYRWFSSRGVIQRDGAGEAIRVTGAHTDITERKLAEDELLHHALHQPLTGLPNRVLFVDRIEHALGLARREERNGLSVLVLDIDHFNIVNDSLGHNAGNALLGQVVQRLSPLVRAGDTLAHFGSDEFAFLLEGMTDPVEAARFADRLKNAFSASCSVAGAEVFVTFGVGIAIASGALHSGEEMLRDAEIALYRAKAKGKSSRVLFDRTMHTQAVEILELDSALRLGLRRSELRVHYQPLVDLKKGVVASLEALVRWEHPERGLLQPADFLPWSERTGLLAEISELVLERACKDLERLRAQLPERELSIAVNVSPDQLLAPNYVERVRVIIDQAGVRPQDVRLEVTEGLFVANVGTARERLIELKELGVLLAMDDFGTGYSSLSALYHLPFDILKLDRSLVSHLGEEQRSQALVHAAIDMGHTLGLTVVAEGVETEAQLDTLAALGCDFFQGFYFSEPVPPGQLEAIVHRRWRR